MERNGGGLAESGGFGPADNGACQKDRGGCRISAGQNEAAQRRQLRIHAVNISLQPLDLSSDNAERHFARCKVFAGGCQIRAKIEEIILDATEQDRKSTRLKSSPYCASRMPSSAWKKQKDTTKDPNTT